VNGMLIQGVFFGLSILLLVGAFMLLRFFFKNPFSGSEANRCRQLLRESRKQARGDADWFL
jgi:hypothetical protein